MEKRKSKSINRIFFISLIFTIFISSFSLSFALICDSEYCYIEFTSDDTWIVPDGVTQADVLLVAGGGGGAGNTAFSNAGGGAGGAGGLIFEENLTLSLSSYPITIGQGGNGVNQPNVVAQNGEDTIAFGLTALGGGGGILTAANNNNPASNGGSGGGGRDNPAGLGLQPGSIWGGFGNNGGRNSNDLGGAGGGGAGSAAIDISGEDGGNGGNGLYFGDIYGDIYGDNGWFAGGGGGGARTGTLGTGGIGGGGDGSQPTGNIAPQNGMANTGGGGGGGSSSHAGANGGSGVVLVRFENPAASINIIEQPTDKELGQTFSPFPQVEVLGLQSFPLENILVEVGINNGSFEPSTTQVLTDINGIATFDNLNISSLGNYSLNFSVIGYDLTIESQNFEVIPGVPNSVEILTQPNDTIQNSNINPIQLLVRSAFGTPIPDLILEVSLNGGSFSSGTLNITTNSSGIAEFSDLQISNIGDYNLSFQIINYSSINNQTNNFSIYSPIVPTINVFNIVDGGIYRIPEIEINFNATSLNPIDFLWYFNGTNNITFTNPINISLDVGIYTFEFFANDSFGQINSTVLTFEMVDTPIVNVSPNNGSKFFNSETIPLRFNSSFPIDNVAFYINNDSSNLTDMVTWDFEQWEYDLNINNRGIYNITFVYDVNSLIQETFNLTNILILEDAHRIITKSISNFGTDLYLIDIFVENKIPIISSFTVLDYVGFNFNSGSYTPVFDFINNFIFGRVLGWQNFTQNQSISYSTTADNLNSSLIRNFRIGFE